MLWMGGMKDAKFLDINRNQGLFLCLKSWMSYVLPRKNVLMKLWRNLISSAIIRATKQNRKIMPQIVQPPEIISEMPSESSTMAITPMPTITNNMTTKLPKFYFILSFTSSFFKHPGSLCILNTISVLHNSQFMEEQPFSLLTALWLPRSIDFEIHSFRHSSWMQAMEPEQLQGDILGLSSSQQMRHLGISLGSIVFSDYIIYPTTFIISCIQIDRIQSKFVFGSCHWLQLPISMII